VTVSLPASSSPAPQYRKPRANLYTALLAIALVAVLLGILCLYLVLESYEWKSGPSAMVAPPGAAAVAQALAPQGTDLPGGTALASLGDVPGNSQPVV
jgi:hypothetical protein